MKFKDGQKVITLIDKENIKKGTVGYIVFVFDSPNEAYEVEFCNDEDYKPWAYATYLPEELGMA